MGRKKIEIKPLTDERNRNVTFLKRKAGLMKKAYELSVLCGVSVSILIFGANGKPYEFCSGDFDTEVDRYQDYEGTIERRRAAEFEAMALAGEDDEDEDDDRPAAAAGAKKPTVTKSLKGKESFKTRRVPRTDRSDRDRDRRRPRERERERAADESFIGGVLEEEGDVPHRPDSPTTQSLSYAMGLHQSAAQQAPAWPQYRPSGPYLPFPNGPTFVPQPSIPSGGGGGGGGGSWDNSMLTTYAWLQIQQAHQEQKRALLERQQHQLLELTSRSGGHGFIRDMLGVGLGGGGSSGTGTSSQSSQEFVWPTASAHDGATGSAQAGVTTPPDEDLIWALGGMGGQVSPSMAPPVGPGPSPVPSGNMPSWRVEPRSDERASKRVRS